MVTTLSNFVMQAYLSYKALSWGGLTPFVWNRLGRPIFFVVMFTLLGRFAGNPAAAEAFIIGMAAAAIPGTVLDGILPMFTLERGFKTISALFATGASRTAFFWSRGPIHLVNGLVSASAALVFAGVLLGLDFSRVNWGLLAASALAISASVTAFALFAGNLSLVLRSWTNLSLLLQGSLIALTGAIVPIASLPVVLRWVSEVLPVTHGLVAFRAAFAGNSFAEAADGLLLELGVALAYGVLGTLLFGRFERQAKRRGTLEWEAA